MSEKKYIPLLVLKILGKYSSEGTPLTKTKICDLLKNKYQCVCDRRTVSGAIESLIFLDYPIRFEVIGGKKTNLFLEPILTENEELLLQIALATSPYIDDRSSDKITKKLISSTTIINAENAIDSEMITKNIKALKKAIDANFLVNFSISTRVINNKQHFYKENGLIKVYLVKPLDIIFAYGKALLFCEIGDSKLYRYFQIEQIYDLQITKSKFELFEGIQAPLPRSQAEADSLCFSERAKAVVRVDDCHLASFISMLGEDAEIISKYGEKTELSVITDLRALKQLILRYGSHAEALSPTKLRRALALELQAASSKYPEVRRLRGTI